MNLKVIKWFKLYAMLNIYNYIALDFVPQFKEGSIMIQKIFGAAGIKH